MRRIYYLTGTTGWVGNEILKQLISKNEEVVIFIRKETKRISEIKDKVRIVYGDIRNEDDIRKFLSCKKDKNISQIIIHAAAYVSIKDNFDIEVFNTNYFGTKLLADIALENKVEKFIYISSTEALEIKKDIIQKESFEFEDNPEKGCYAISKAMAASYIHKLSQKGLNTMLLHPSGIIGPDDPKSGALTTMVKSFLKGHVPASIKDGAYNLVDVRDVASAVIKSANLKSSGENYLLTGKSLQITGFLNNIADKYNRKRIKIKLHPWFIKLIAPIYGLFCRIFRLTPLYTKSAIETVLTKPIFDNSKAKNDLGFSPRDIDRTITDMCNDIISKDKKCLKGRRPLTPRGRLTVLGGGLLTFLVLFLIRYIPGVSEAYTRTIGKSIAFLLGHVFTWIPFSIFEVSFFLILISIILWLVFFITSTVKKGIKKSYTRIVDLGIVVASLLSLYSMTFSFAYYRDKTPVPQYTEILEDTSKYKEIVSFYEEDFNNLANTLSFDEEGSVVSPYTWSELNAIIKEDYKLLDGDDYYFDFTLNGKPMYTLSWLYSELQITGITFPYTYEPNYNIDCPASEIPFTLAHEIAHTKGVMREEDANLVAAYICLNSSDPYIRYSGYFCTFFSLDNLVRATNVESDYAEYINAVHPNIWKDMAYTSKYWKEHDLLGEIGEFFNNLYLQISASETTDSYIDHDDVVPIDDGGQTIYKVYSYSPYQALYLYMYFNK